MSYELKKPITEQERMDFVSNYIYKQGLRLEDTEMFLFALETNEIMGEKEIDIEVPEYDEEDNPIMIEYEDTETIIDYDEDGNSIGSHEITVIKHKQKTHIETITIPYPVINPDCDQEQADRREAEFNKAFFNTSLGYIRRKVTMQDGSKKDFLSDLVLSIKAGLEQGLDVKIIAYDKPPFDRDIEDWTVYQHIVSATPQFIAECLQQVVRDFGAFDENTPD